MTSDVKVVHTITVVDVCLDLAYAPELARDLFSATFEVWLQLKQKGEVL